MTEARVHLPRSHDYARGSWVHADGLEYPIFCCPDCHFKAGMSLHTIKADGEVNASVLCPQCHWHQWVVLDGWIFGEFPSKEGVGG